MQAIDLCRKIVFDLKSDNGNEKKVIISYIIAVQVLAMLVLGVCKLYGKQKNSYSCWFSDYGVETRSHRIILWIMQINLMIAVGAFLMICGKALHIMRQSWKMSGSSEDISRVNQRLSTMLSLFVMPLCCLIIFLVIWTIVSYGTYEDSSRQQIYEKSLKEWVKCVFKNFDGTKRSWVSTCGPHAKERMNVKLKYLIFSMGLCGNSIFVAFFLLVMSWSLPSLTIFDILEWMTLVACACFNGSIEALVGCWNEFVENRFSEYLRSLVNSEKFDYMRDGCGVEEPDNDQSPYILELRWNNRRVVPDEDELNQCYVSSSHHEQPTREETLQYLSYQTRPRKKRSSKSRRLSRLRSMNILSPIPSSGNQDADEEYKCHAHC
jgi:hypothetical protein